MLPTGREASPGVGAYGYERHRPERTLLYQLIQEYYPAFKVHLKAQGTVLPEYVQQEFEDFLKCGRLEHGFLRVRCDLNLKIHVHAPFLNVVYVVRSSRSAQLSGRTGVGRKSPFSDG